MAKGLDESVFEATTEWKTDGLCFESRKDSKQMWYYPSKITPSKRGLYHPKRSK